jgi:hypothetical protein
MPWEKAVTTIKENRKRVKKCFFMLVGKGIKSMTFYRNGYLLKKAKIFGKHPRYDGRVLNVM